MNKLPFMVIMHAVSRHAMKAYSGSRGSSLNLSLGTTWRWVVNFTPRPLYPPVTIEYRAGWVPDEV